MEVSRDTIARLLCNKWHSQKGYCTDDTRARIASSPVKENGNELSAMLSTMSLCRCGSYPGADMRKWSADMPTSQELSFFLFSFFFFLGRSCSSWPWSQGRILIRLGLAYRGGCAVNVISRDYSPTQRRTLTLSDSIHHLLSTLAASKKEQELQRSQ